MADANTVGEIPKAIRMKLYGAVERAFKAPDFPPEIIAKWGAAAHDSSGRVRLQLLQAFVDDPSCATMVVQEAIEQESTTYDGTEYVMLTRDELEREWRHLPPERLAAKVEQLMATAKSQRAHPRTGEVMYEVLGKIQNVTSSAERRNTVLHAHANVASSAAAAELRGFMLKPPAARAPKAIADAAPAEVEEDPKKAAAKKRREAAQKKRQEKEAAQAEARAKAAAAGLPDPTVKAKPFVHPGVKLSESIRRKVAAATQLRCDIEIAAPDMDDRSKQVTGMLDAVVGKGDAMVARLTTEVRAARGEVSAAWAELAAEAEKVLEEVETELKFGKSRLQGLKKPAKKAKAA